VPGTADSCYREEESRHLRPGLAAWALGKLLGASLA